MTKQAATGQTDPTNRSDRFTSTGQTGRIDRSDRFPRSCDIKPADRVYLLTAKFIYQS